MLRCFVVKFVTFIDVKTIHYTGDIGHLSTKYLGNYLGVR